METVQASIELDDAASATPKAAVNNTSNSLSLFDTGDTEAAKNVAGFFLLLNEFSLEALAGISQATGV